MSILNQLEDSLKSDIPAYMEFLRRFDPKKKQVFVFYEGDEDAAFYQQFICKAKDEDVDLEEIIAGCKNNVIKIHDSFDWNHYNKNQVIFIVDRDLSYWLEEKDVFDNNVFVTDGYSFENYIVNRALFIDWIERFMGFTRALKTEKERMACEFEEVLCSFRQSMMPIMAKAVVAKRHDKTISLSDYKLTKHLSLNVEENHVIVKLSDATIINEKWKLQTDDADDIAMQIEKFKRDQSHYWVRGKWDIYFMAYLGDVMRQHARVFAPSLQREKLNPVCDVSCTKCSTALAPYWKKSAPQRLEIFINQTIAQYCREVS